jgi:trigger factor
VKVSAQEIEQRQVVLEIEVDRERVDRAMDQAYKRIVNRINVPGFRRGRAPRPLVERMVGREAILEDAVEHLVPQVYQAAIEEQQLKPAGQPSLQVTSTDPLQFKATVPLEPTVVLGDYQSIQVPREPLVVEEDEVESVISNIRESHATWVPVERPAQIGDRAAFDVVATRGERTVMDTKDAEFVLDPSGPEPAPGFSNQLVGMSAGDDRTFALGGREGDADAEPVEPTQFTVHLQGVKEKQLPELDDEFARTAGEKDSMDELRDEIREQIRLHKQQLARERQREAIVKAAVEQARIDMPPQLVERQASRRLETLSASLDKQGITVEQYLQFVGKDESALRSELLEDATQTLKTSLVLEKIAETEGLEITDDEIRSEIEQASSSSNDPARTARQALERAETRASFADLLRRRKALERLVELAGGGDQEPATATEVSLTSGETNG